MRTATVVLCAALVAATAGCNTAGAPVKGDIAPEFVLQSTTGAVRKLSNYRGKIVLVNLWATWCPPCIAELPVLDQLSAAYADKGLVILAVAGDEDTQAVHDFLARSPVKFEVLLDPNGAIGTQYGITGYPETFFVDRQGKLQDKIIGPLPHEGPGASKELTKRIEELLGG
ncbi:MAG: TlpA family protein disulfide reductase [Candidatus Binatia bacterium]